MSKEELLKYLIAEIDLIMHDKDYRFENQDGTWYSRESCRDLTNEEVLEELRTELRQFDDLEAKLAEKEKTIQAYEKIVEQKDEEIRFANRDKIYIVKQLNDPKDYVLLEDYKKVEQQLAEKEQEIESLRENSLSKRIFKEKLIPSHCMEQYEKYEQQIDKLTKDKISFAVEQLEKVKENIKKVPIIDFDLSGNFEKMYKQDAIRQIDNQIKELKGEETI